MNGVKPRFHFVIPNPEGLPSGGNIFNRYFMSGLSGLGIEVSHSEFPEVAKAASWDPGTWYIFDTLYAGQLTSTGFEFPSNLHSLYLIHHLESLYPPPEEEQEAIFETKERPLLDLFDGYLVTSEFTRRYLLDKQIRKPIWVIPPVLHFSPDLAGREAVPVGGPVKILMVANLIERKGILEFLRRLGNYTAPKDEFQVSIAGDGGMEPQYAESCKKLVEENETLTERITFLGARDEPQVRELYKSHHIFVSSSKMETYGMAIQEAVSNRMPALVLNRGNSAWHIDQSEKGAIFATQEDLVKGLLTWVRERSAIPNPPVPKDISLTPTDRWMATSKNFLDQFMTFAL